MLKTKEEINYRRGPTWGCCGDCNHFVPAFQVRSCGRGGEVVDTQGRCRIIGLEHGRMYRVLPHFICDRFDNSEKIKRLTEGTAFEGGRRCGEDNNLKPGGQYVVSTS